jgi:hypothetical protein
MLSASTSRTPAIRVCCGHARASSDRHIVIAELFGTSLSFNAYAVADLRKATGKSPSPMSGT